MSSNQSHAQSTAESCLAMCLLRIAKLKISKRTEWQLFSFALRFSKASFTLGHLEWISKRLRLAVTLDIGVTWYWRIVKALPRSRRVNVRRSPVTLNTIAQALRQRPVIAYIDGFYLWKRIHYPHFIVIEATVGSGVTIYDPWDGVRRTVSRSLVQRALNSLRFRLRMAPQLIYIASRQSMPGRAQ